MPKFERNINNDKKHIEELEKEGWKVIVIWECEIKRDFENTMDCLIVNIQSN